MKTVKTTANKDIEDFFDSADEDLQKASIKAVKASKAPISAVGFVAGNNGSKIVLNHATRKFLGGYFQQNPDVCHGEAADSESGAYVEIEDSTHQVAVGDRYRIGQLAYDANPVLARRVVDIPNGKKDFVLHQFLGAIALLPHQDEWRIQLCLSSPYQNYADPVKQALQGVHRVRLNQCRESVLTVEVAGIRPEGHAGVAYHCLKTRPTGNTVAFDFGHGTLMGLVVEPSGRLVAYNPFPGGVDRLITAISRHDLVVDRLGKPGDKENIRLGIRNGNLRYGGRPERFSFEAAYRQLLAQWLKKRIEVAAGELDAHVQRASNFVALGGGAAMPGVAELLAQAGVSVVEDPQFIDAIGLCSMARQLQGAQQ